MNMNDEIQRTNNHCFYSFYLLLSITMYGPMRNEQIFRRSSFILLEEHVFRNMKTNENIQNDTTSYSNHFTQEGKNMLTYHFCF